ncbi:hypothetical protein PHYSODRAFT_339777 [Phytophthora sojae]|uniref:Uncharacterized protein n=1 Tax=Phytophthora sojae (strain P6497) TaxID=1094619 RepID=G5A7K2_PHYSP|nr:hypothetical protein PHYSODRAFT_339777 [Phytophthora sojae]EGZ07878.1 hypothetical protein PHYSODRAFT_339777 [Phytophthora sojae]|eukprot:XP_009536050.1 hypothetical protein PHYSODRAFT_339777 [Phytophthora sojae]
MVRAEDFCVEESGPDTGNLEAALTSSSMQPVHIGLASLIPQQSFVAAEQQRGELLPSETARIKPWRSSSKRTTLPASRGTTCVKLRLSKKECNTAVTERDQVRRARTATHYPCWASHSYP